MAQIILEVLIVGLFTGLVGIIWMIVRDCFDDGHDSVVKQIGGTPLSEPHDRVESHKHSPPHSNIAA
ncbi:MAG: hypothetical protein ABIO96_06560 [Nitrospiraceae bacterium]